MYVTINELLEGVSYNQSIPETETETETERGHGKQSVSLWSLTLTIRRRRRRRRRSRRRRRGRSRRGRSRRDESRWHGQPTLRLPERGQGFVLLHQVQTALDATHHTRFVLSFILSKPRFAHLPESASRFLVLFLFEIMAEGYIHGSKYEKPRELVVLL